MVDKSSSTPLYQQIETVLLERIASGDYPTGTKIHSESQLCAEFGVGRPTIRQAISSLVRRGQLESFKGKGVFVREPKQQLDLLSTMGTTEAFSRLGKTVTTDLLNRFESADWDLLHFSSEQDALWIQLERLRTVDKTPVIWERTYIAPELVPGFDAVNLDQQSLHSVLATIYKVKPEKINQFFDVRKPSKDVASILNLPASRPLLYLEREYEINGQSGQYYVQLFVDTAEYRLYQEILSPEV